MKTSLNLWQVAKRTKSDPARVLAKRIRRGKLTLEELTNLLGRALTEARDEGREDERECQRIVEERKHPVTCDMRDAYAPTHVNRVRQLP